ncbi:hypothetical protein L915_08997 [Phytophthora nicotianae]|uniref:Uncharacterized protein n=1 Tax=Phytophthora nicotianae TaxID=4792 RepID=W2J0B7_PHYNI|nr:hypothetical protein L915_08997 [Phytophthora nicotianae]ETL39796.1 hypothetical protein L916_08907 [Phytophthora nicotianae]
MGTKAENDDSAVAETLDAVTQRFNASAPAHQNSMNDADEIYEQQSVSIVTDFDQ